MNLAELFPALIDAAARLRREGSTAPADGVEALVQRLAGYGHHTVEDLPLRAPKKIRVTSARKSATPKPPALDETEALAQLTQLFESADQPGNTPETIRVRVTAIAAAVKLPSLRKIGKTFLHLPLTKRSKQDIADLLYSHIARRQERTSW